VLGPPELSITTASRRVTGRCFRRRGEAYLHRKTDRWTDHPPTNRERRRRRVAALIRARLRRTRPRQQGLDCPDFPATTAHVTSTRPSPNAVSSTRSSTPRRSWRTSTWGTPLSPPRWSPSCCWLRECSNRTSRGRNRERLRRWQSVDRLGRRQRRLRAGLPRISTETSRPAFARRLRSQSDVSRMVNGPIASVRFVTLAIRRTYERRTRNGASAVVIAALTMATLVGTPRNSPPTVPGS